MLPIPDVASTGLLLLLLILLSADPEGSGAPPPTETEAEVADPALPAWGKTDPEVITDVAVFEWDDVEN